MNSLPTHTIYVNNLNEKIKIRELRMSLYTLFSGFGEILDITATSSAKMRGQAFIAFRELSSACTAILVMQQFPFYGKPMRIAFAKKESDIVIQMKHAYRQQSQWMFSSGGMLNETESLDLMVKRPPKVEPPNSVLFVSKLPETADEDMLKSLFGKFPGLKDVRLVPNRFEIAFIEYDDDKQSAVAKDALQGYNIAPNHALHIEFAKK